MSNKPYPTLEDYAKRTKPDMTAIAKMLSESNEFMRDAYGHTETYTSIPWHRRALTRIRDAWLVLIGKANIKESWD